jgi:hypothetical protein
MIITGFFLMAIGKDILIMLSYLIFAIIITSAGTFAAVFYLHALKYQKRERFLPRTHYALNKSIRLRGLFRFIKIPHFSNMNNLIKSFKLAS